MHTYRLGPGWKSWAKIIGLALVILGVGGCATSRPAVVRNPVPGPDGSSDPGDTFSLRLMTFNVWGLPSWLVKGGSPDRFDRIAAEIEREAPDTVLFQEIWTTRAERAMPDSAEWSVVTGDRSSWICRRSGLVTLSRYPVVSAEFRPFRRAYGVDVLVTKGALRTTLDLGGGRLMNLWNVHLQAGRSGLDRRVRLQQIAELERWMGESEKGQVLDVVGGDFNCLPNSAEHRRLTAFLGPDLQTALRRSPGATFHAPGNRSRPAKTIDYFFCVGRGGWTLRNGASEVLFAAEGAADRLSDHFALQVALDFKTTDPRPVMPGGGSLASVSFDPLPLPLRLAPVPPQE